MIDMVRTWIVHWIESCLETVLDLFRVRAAIAYLHLVRGTRRFFIVLALLLLCAVVFACGFLMIPIALLLFMPWDPQTKAIVGIAIGAAYVVVPVIVAAVLLSDRQWMRMSRADDLLRSVRR